MRFSHVFLLASVLGVVAVAQTPGSDTAKGATELPADAVGVSNKALNRMRTIVKEVIGKLDEARAGKDIVKLNCVNDKLVQLKALLKVSESADVNLQEALAKQDTSTAQHEFTKVQLADTRSVDLRTQVEACSSELSFRTDENLVVDVEEPSDLPKNIDPTAVNPTPVNVVTRPPVASSIR